MGAIGSYADRLADHIEDAPGLAGAASGLAGSSLAHRITGSDSESSGEDFRSEIRARLDLMDERLQRLEDEMHTLREEGGSEGDLGDLTEPGVGPDPESSR